MKLYKIRDWDRLFENNRSRELKNVSWVVVPNKHDGESYSLLIREKKAAEMFSAWILMLQIASKCTPRGTLIKGNGTPHTPHSLAAKSQAPAGWFESALDYLERNTDWLVIEDIATDPAGGCGIVAPRDEEGKGREGNGKKGMEGKENGAPRPLEVAQQIFDEWNLLKELPQCLVVSDKRRRELAVRLKESFFVANWRPAMAKISASAFLTGNNERKWKANFDWFIRSDTVTKIMEGKYDNAQRQQLLPVRGSKPTPQGF